ncbi:RNA polymerase sigma-70 factor [Mucilaginibacter conchicola]|uniref:RNA polymerase sigma-70 factor n=1 Tax=Mucilaginibacter conchicola TaxID=2303333 RepID=A0A372NPE0_9SPHI|nr:RNA polymerase sigma-70 factor [Mucilaginibacter conchicola]RFZ90235.1 RNA polymerase sigma-70 factor [Mucilaginibacter conchicola]
MRPDENLTDDFALAALLRSGDELAFSSLYDRYWSKIYLAARNRMGNKADAEELVQDLFYKLWKRRAVFELTKGFDNYFAVAVKYEIINRLAKRSRATVLERELGRRLSDIDESTIQALDYSELQERYNLVINQLPERCQLVFRLQQERGMSQSQIAEEMSISIKTVENQLLKARKSLRKQFGGLLPLLLL